MIQEPQESTANRPRTSLGESALPAIVGALTFLAYAATLAFGFVFDDRGLIVENPWLRSWRFVARYFTGHFFSFEYPHLLGNYYRPAFLFWLRVNYFFFALSAWKWHLANVALHVSVAYLVYALARRLVDSPWNAAVAALVFGLHPANIEVAAYLSAGAESLATLLVLASLLCYFRWRNPARERALAARLWLAASGLLYGLALLTMEAALTLPILVLVCELLFRHETAGSDRNSVGRAVETLGALLPYLVLTAIYLVARVAALKGLSHDVTPLPLLTLLLTAPSVLTFYLKHLLWPLGQSPYYDTSYVTPAEAWKMLLPCALLLGFGALLGIWWRKVRATQAVESRAMALALALMVAPLLFALDLRVFPEGEIAHDRYLYLPSVGFALLVALAFSRARFGRTSLWGQSPVQLGLAAGLAAFLGACTLNQSLYWADELSLYGRAHEIAPRNLYATTSLAAAAAARGYYPAAIKLYQQVLERQPNFWRANVNLAYLYYEMGNLAEADRYFTRSIVSDPVDGNQYLYLALTRLRMGRLADAEGLIRHALVVRPDGPGYHLALGLVLKEQGKLDAALAEIKTELADNPGDQRARQLADELEKRRGP